MVRDVLVDVGQLAEVGGDHESDLETLEEKIGAFSQAISVHIESVGCRTKHAQHPLSYPLAEGMLFLA